MTYDDEIADLRAVIKQLSEENNELKQKLALISGPPKHLGMTLCAGEMFVFGDGFISVLCKGKLRGGYRFVVKAPSDLLVKREESVQDNGEGTLAQK